MDGNVVKEHHVVMDGLVDSFVSMLHLATIGQGWIRLAARQKIRTPVSRRVAHPV
jgi:hypothetical protein